MPDIDHNTESAIFSAAKRIFTDRGFDGTRMHLIADEAGINKALLHYYFRSKEKLFEAVIKDITKTYIPAINRITTTALPLFEKIRLFVNIFSDILSRNPNLAGFVLNELRINPGRFTKILKEAGIDLAPVKEQLENEMAAGNIRAIKTNHLLTNLISLTVFPFIAKSFYQEFAGMDEKLFSQFTEERKTLIPEIIIQSIKVLK